MPPGWGGPAYAACWEGPGSSSGLAKAVTGPAPNPRPGRASSPAATSRGYAASGWALPSEERPLLETQAGQDLFHARAGQRPDPRTQAGLLDRRDLRDDHGAPLWKVPFALPEQDVPRLARPVQVRRQRAHDHGRHARVVEDVVLDHHVGVGAARDGPSRVVRYHPEHVAAVDPRRTCARLFSLVRLRARGVSPKDTLWRAAASPCNLLVVRAASARGDRPAGRRSPGARSTDPSRTLLRRVRVALAVAGSAGAHAFAGVQLNRAGGRRMMLPFASGVV